jgi:UrcA family protein
MFTKITFARLMLAAALTSALAGQASADSQPTPEVKSQKVSYADLNLSRPRDVQVLLQRIRRAAVSVCSVGGESSLAQASGAYPACIRTASAEAVSQLNQAMATAIPEHASPIKVAEN